MVLPFSFTDTLTIPDGAFKAQLTRQLEVAIESEGGNDIRATVDRITFRGLTSYLSFSPLSNVARGRIDLHDRESSVDMTYAIMIDRTPFVFSGLAIAVGIGLVAAGLNQFGFLIAFGLGILILSIVFSFAIRFRVRRWLRRILSV
jgi:hypothetical protein